jgi:hypothetical protein
VHRGESVECCYSDKAPVPLLPFRSKAWIMRPLFDRGGTRMGRGCLLVVSIAVVAAAAQAEGIDRDSLLSEAPAVPDKGTVRVSGGAAGTNDSDANSSGQAAVSGSVSWTPIDRLSADVGAYWQVGQNGPSARLRYQILSQWFNGIDLSAGVRFKTVGFHPDNGEVEMLLAAGRRFGQLEFVLNGVFGVETGGGAGKDVEVKAFGGWRFDDAVRAGIDERLQVEVGDEEDVVGATVQRGRDYDFTAGPAISWIVARNLGGTARNLQLQALVGVAQPKKTDLTGAVGIVSASVDF